MGMFDDVKCEYPLPDPQAQGILFQTKDLDCFMDLYTITKEGRLVQHYNELELVPKEERPYPDAPEGSIQAMVGCLRIRAGSERLIDRDYHGYLNIYGSNDLDNRDEEWFEYDVKFTDGNVVGIERVVREGM